MQPQFLAEHLTLSRRFFLQAGLSLGAVSALSPLVIAEESSPPKPRTKPDKAGAQPEPYFTPVADFRDVSRGKPIPHTLLEENKKEIGLTRETWKLDVLADPDHPPKLGKTFTQASGTAFDFAALMKLAETHAVRFPKVMTCLNLGCPLGMGLWEGVPLRELIWQTQPRENLRRVFYYGYHNADPAQMFRSSLPIGRVLEDPDDLPPVILCYKLNGEWLDAERGGPVRIVVPEAYGFKSIKWLSHVVLTNLAHANDTYAEQNNDVDSPMKTFAATLQIPKRVKSGEPIAVSGYAQVGMGGLSKVQISIEPSQTDRADDPWFLKASWVDAELLPAPARWTGLAEEKLIQGAHRFNAAGRPDVWPMRLMNAHWAGVLPGLPAGSYLFRCRTIDAKGHPQPLPRPFRKSGHATIESVEIKVEAT